MLRKPMLPNPDGAEAFLEAQYLHEMEKLLYECSGWFSWSGGFNEKHKKLREQNLRKSSTNNKLNKL